MNQQKKYIVIDIETDGLWPWYGNRITCICAKDSYGDNFQMTDHDEIKLINSFIEWLQSKTPQEYFLITKNGKQFDIPFILTRLAIKTGAYPEDAYSLLMFDHLDLQELTKKKIPLDDMARLFKCRLKSGTGENAVMLWKMERFDDLLNYCMQDVEITEEVYLKWKNLK